MKQNTEKKKPADAARLWWDISCDEIKKRDKAPRADNDSEKEALRTHIISFARNCVSRLYYHLLNDDNFRKAIYIEKWVLKDNRERGKYACLVRLQKCFDFANKYKDIDLCLSLFEYAEDNSYDLWTYYQNGEAPFSWRLKNLIEFQKDDFDIPVFENFDKIKLIAKTTLESLNILETLIYNSAHFARRLRYADEQKEFEAIKEVCNG